MKREGDGEGGREERERDEQHSLTLIHCVPYRS